MSMEQELAEAQARAVDAREQLLGAAHAVQARLAPEQIASDAWDAVRSRSEAMADGAARAAAKRPGIASAAALGLVAVIARKPIARLFARLGRN